MANGSATIRDRLCWPGASTRRKGQEVDGLSDCSAVAAPGESRAVSPRRRSEPDDVPLSQAGWSVGRPPKPGNPERSSRTVSVVLVNMLVALIWSSFIGTPLPAQNATNAIIGPLERALTYASMICPSRQSTDGRDPRWSWLTIRCLERQFCNRHRSLQTVLSRKASISENAYEKGVGWQGLRGRREHRSPADQFRRSFTCPCRSAGRAGRIDLLLFLRTGPTISPSVGSRPWHL